MGKVVDASGFHVLNRHASKLCEEGKLKEAVQIMDLMARQDTQVSIKTYVCLLQGCIRLKAMAEGKRIHSHIMQCGFGSHLILGNTLVNMYAKCGSILDARRVFDIMPRHNVLSWMAIISAYTKQGQYEEAINLYWRMRQTSMIPDQFLFVTVLKACAGLADLDQGRKVHAHIIESSSGSDIFMGSALIHMYSKCGSIQDARHVFDQMHEQNVVSWTAMIAGCAQQGCGQEALALFEQMQQQDVKPNSATFINVLKACAGLRALERGKQIHAHIIKSGVKLDISTGNTLIYMYAKCGSIQDACQVFNRMTTKDAISWNAMIAGYAQQGSSDDALRLFDQMQQQGVKPNNITFASILKACAALRAMKHGKQIHALVAESGFESVISVANALVDMYLKCGSIEDALQVFKRMRERDIVSWNVMISGYADLGHSKEAFMLFDQMHREGMKPDKVTLSSILKACASSGAFEKGKLMHACVVKSGYDSDVFMGNALIDMYAKCGNIEAAQQLFNRLHARDVVSWTVLITGYAHQGHGLKALALFEQMQHEGMKPNHFTFAVILKVCASLSALEQGKQVHANIIESGYELDVFVGNTIVDMYVKCKSIEDARKVFGRMCERDVVSWNVMIAGYAQQGDTKEALTLLKQMQKEGMKPDSTTFVSILKACVSVEALECGKQVHAHIVECGFELDAYVGSALIDMYAKCGSIEDACQVFERMQERDGVLWTVMMAGYAQQGHANKALALFEQMQQEGMKPDEITFVCVLAACSHAGLVIEGLHYFESMIQGHGITPSLEHYTSMVDLLGRAGCLDQAADFIHKMPIRPSSVVWMALLGACRSLGNVELGRSAFECVVELEPKHARAYLSLSNIYAAAGRWDDVAKIRKIMEDVGVEENAGC